MHDTGQRSRELEETGAPTFHGPQLSAMKKRTNERTNILDYQEFVKHDLEQIRRQQGPDPFQFSKFYTTVHVYIVLQCI